MGDHRQLRPRPLSPHLQIYRLSITMVMSIVHRLTGLALYFGTLLLVGWLAAAALGEPAFAIAQAIMGHWVGQLVLLGYTWALFHHMLGGLRHFVWDFGAGYGPARYVLGWLTLAGSTILTALVWAFVWFGAAIPLSAGG
ncbi:MAG: succinate dehydrogenase, cytochrome b556 subunit [Alphaproteobacteria bacterium]|nr:succinate dehydrogenase, cytochrome b556 subunit [Alphaproteobacteria bacterium]